MKVCYLVILLHLSCLLLLCSPLPEGVVEKDLYQVLGLKEEGENNVKAIKKAYRMLAQIHHPDKVKGEDKQYHEELFRDIAAAYEVLSNNELRNEYDAERKIYKQMKESGNDETNKRKRQQAQQYYHEERVKQANRYQYSHDDIMDGFAQMEADILKFFGFDEETVFEQEEHESYEYFTPVTTGPIIPAGQIMFPYMPIMISQDESHYAFLDMQCSFGVYKGNVDEFIRFILMTNSIPSLDDIDVEVIYSTPSDDTLNGRCFSGLDEYGILHVFKGHPDYRVYESLWSSASSAEVSNDYYYTRYYLELTNNGELVVRALHAGESESVCVWSTSTCNEYLKSIKELKSTTTSIMSSIGKSFRNIVSETKRVGLIAVVLQRLSALRDLLERVMDAVIAVVSGLYDQLINI